jgi:hypothetical protein
LTQIERTHGKVHSVNTILTMKTRSRIVCALLGLASAISMHAQDQVLPAVKNAADPFTRDGNPTSAQNEQATSPYNLYGLVEYIEVPVDTWLSYVASHPVHHDVTELRAEVQRWIVAGKARPFEITCVPTRSGNRMVVENILEHRYPIEYLPASPRPVPKTFETRNTHFTFEWEPIGGIEGKSIDTQSAAQVVTHVGDLSIPSPSPTSPQPTPLSQPRFVTVKHTLTDSVSPNVPTLFGVSTPSDATGKRREDVRLLCFFRTAPVPIPKPANPPKESVLYYIENEKRTSMSKGKWEELQKAAGNDSVAKAKADDIREQFREGRAYLSNTRLSLEGQRLEVSLADLNSWFVEKPLDAATSGLQTTAMEWVRAGRGRVIDQRSGAFRSGNRGVWEDIHEIRYASEYAVEGEVPQIEATRHLEPKTFAEQLQILTLNRAPKTTMLKDPAISPASFETRNAGFTVEFEPLLQQDGSTVDIQLAVNETKLAGYVPYYQREISGKMQTAIEQPIWGTMKISTNLSVTLGKSALLAVMTPMDDDMKPSRDRRILTFLTVRD